MNAGLKITIMKLEYINPDSMAPGMGYSHAIAVSGPHKTLYIGGQNAIDPAGNVKGGTLKEQSEQVLDNIEKVLHSAGGTFKNLVKMNIFLLQGQDPREGFAAFQQKWKQGDPFPLVTVAFVSGLGRPGCLVEIDGIALIAE